MTTVHRTADGKRLLNSKVWLLRYGQYEQCDKLATKMSLDRLPWALRGASQRVSVLPRDRHSLQPVFASPASPSAPAVSHPLYPSALDCTGLILSGRVTGLILSGGVTDGRASLSTISFLDPVTSFACTLPPSAGPGSSTPSTSPPPATPSSPAGVVAALTHVPHVWD